MDDLGDPASYITLEPGVPVYSCDGEEIGKVSEVRAEPDVDIFDCIVVATGMISGETKIIPAEQIEEIFERGVLLKLDAERARALAS
jgi:uncharacterized protein YrrD